MGSNRKIVFGVVLVAIGLLLLAGELHIGSFIGPLALIGVGVWLLMRRRKQEQESTPEHEFEVHMKMSDSGHTTAEPEPETSDHSGIGPPPPRPPGPQSSASARLKYSQAFGDIFVDCAGKTLQNVEVSTFIGDVEIKLHGGKMERGLNRMIISGFIGDVRVLVPAGMPVSVQSSNFIGDVDILGRRSTGFGNSVHEQSPDYATADSKMYVVVNHFIGDIRVFVV